MQQYETTFILTPVLSEDDIKQSIDGYRKHLTDGNAEIINEKEIIEKPGDF